MNRVCRHGLHLLCFVWGVGVGYLPCCKEKAQAGMQQDMVARFLGSWSPSTGSNPGAAGAPLHAHPILPGPRDQGALKRLKPPLLEESSGAIPAVFEAVERSKPARGREPSCQSLIRRDEL